MKRILTTLIASLCLATAQDEPDLALLLQEATFAAETAGDLAKAAALFKRLEKEPALTPTQREQALRQYAKVLDGLGKLKEAKALRQQLLEEFPESPHASEWKSQAKAALSTAERFARLELLGVWRPEEASETVTHYAEFLPNGRYLRLPHPLDATTQDGPSPPLSQATYRFAEDGQLMIEAPGKEPQTWSWRVRKAVLELTTPDQSKQRYTRARRPYRFPRDVNDVGQLVALLNLKEREVEATERYLENEGALEHVGDLLASSLYINEELRRLNRGTTAAALVDTGLELLDLAAQHFAEGKPDLGGQLLASFDALHWNAPVGNKDLRAATSPYHWDATSLIGTWDGHWEGIGAATITFHSSTFDPLGNAKSSWESSSAELMAGFNGTPYYRVEGDSLTIGDSDDSSSDRVVRMVYSGDQLGLYDENGVRVAFLKRRDSAIAVSCLDLYFGGHFAILEAIIPVSAHERLRRRLRDDIYHFVTVTEGTPTGLMARTAMRQLTQLDQAHLAGDDNRVAALQRALVGTLYLVLVDRLPHVLPSLDMIVSKEPTEQETPSNAVYDGAIQLRSKLLGGNELGAAADSLKRRILTEKLLTQTLESVPPEVQQALKKLFGDLPAWQFADILANRLTVTTVENHWHLKVVAFPHHDPEVAAALGNQLAKLITALPPKEGHAQWELAQLASVNALPTRLMVAKIPPPAPAPAPSTTETPTPRGVHPRLAHRPFEFQQYVLRYMTDDGRRVRLSAEHFVVFEIDGKRGAIKPDPSRAATEETLPFTVITWEDGQATTHATLAHRTIGPGGYFYGMKEFPIYAGPDGSGPGLWLSPIERSSGLVISAARTAWSDPAEIDFDHPGLRWYRLER